MHDFSEAVVGIVRMQTSLMETLRWLRAIGDTVTAAGIVGVVWHVLGLRTLKEASKLLDQPARRQARRREFEEV